MNGMIIDGVNVMECPYLGMPHYCMEDRTKVFIKCTHRPNCEFKEMQRRKNPPDGGLKETK